MRGLPIRPSVCPAGLRGAGLYCRLCLMTAANRSSRSAPAQARRTSGNRSLLRRAQQ